MPNKPSEPMTPDYMDMNVNNRTFGTRKILKEYRAVYSRLQAAEKVVEIVRNVRDYNRHVISRHFGQGIWLTDSCIECVYFGDINKKMDGALAQYDKQKEGGE